MTNSSNQQGTPQQQVQLMRILSFFFCGSILMVAGVLSTIAFPAFDFHRFVSQIQVPMSSGLFATAVIVLSLRRFLADQVLKISIKGHRESGAIDYFRVYLMSHIIRLALAEAGVLIGFVLVITSNQKEWMGFALLVVAALMAILNEIPSYESVKAHIQHLDPQAKV